MHLQPRAHEAISALIDKGVQIPNPLTLDIGPEVDLDRISGEDVVIYPGSRIYGAGTVISAGARLGAEAPVTIDNCRLGPQVQLKGGYFAGSVFLARSGMGSGAQVREGCLLEEEANGAHCVGLKQTILFPFVTLGSLINFCDALMASGTSRKDHAEVGSSYIHFNFTPDGDKATASMFGDVPRGVMLNQPPIFLGGQGGAVGPVRVGYGTVVGAGSVLRNDVPDDGNLVLTKALPGLQRPVSPRSYRNLSRLLANNLRYLANLVALEQWYQQVRRPFFEAQELGDLVYEGALDVLASAKAERTKRLGALVAKVSPTDAARAEVREHIDEVLAVFAEPEVPDGAAFLAAWRAYAQADGDYVATVQAAPTELQTAGTSWLSQTVEELLTQAAAALPSDLAPR